MFFSALRRPRLDLHGDPDLDLGLGADAASLLDNSSARHKMSIRPKKRHADPRARSQDRDARYVRLAGRSVLLMLCISLLQLS